MLRHLICGGDAIKEYSAKRGSSPIWFISRKWQSFCLSLLAMACSDPKVTLTHALNITSV